MLNKENRLTKAADFRSAYSKGLFAAAKQMVVYYYPNVHGSPIRVGFVASKKVGKSHVRSRCKRLMREAMRQMLPGLVPGYDLVVVARPPLAGEDYQGVYHVMAKLLRRAKLLRQ